MAPFGVPELVAAAAGASPVLDAGCGGARLTLALAGAGAAEVVGFDAGAGPLAQGRTRMAAHPEGGRVRLIEADFNQELPFGDDHFAATVSRLALMAATDPVATLRELGRVTTAGGPIATALWAPVADNPWFGLPRTAVGAVMGAQRSGYARAFGRLGRPEQAIEIHRAAGLTDVRSVTLRQTLDVADAAGLWDWLIAENGHVRRLDSTLDATQRGAVIEELHGLAAVHLAPDGTLRLPRTMTLVTATA